MTVLKVSVVCFVFLLSACRANDTLKPDGDKATVVLWNQLSYMVELVTICQDTLIVVPDAGSRPEPKLYGIALADIASVEIHGYVNNKWKTSIVLFQVIPTGLFAAAAAGVSGDNVVPALLLFGVPTLIVYAIFQISNPDPPSARGPLNPDAIEELRKYVRFPPGLNDDQWRTLLRQFGQTEIEALP